MITVKFHKSIRKYTNNCSSFTSDAHSYLEIIQNCMGMFPKLTNVFKSFMHERPRHEEFVFIANNKIVGNDMLEFPAKKNITLCPVIYGGGGKGIMIIAAVAIIALAVFVPGGAVVAGGLGSVGTTSIAGAISSGFSLSAISFSFGAKLLLGIGINLFLSAVMAPKPPKPIATPDSNQGVIRRNNDAFDGLQNSTATQTPVFLNYGMTRISGQFVSGYIKTVNHGLNDIIEVGAQF